MNKNIELVKNTIIISIGKICTQLVSFLLLPLYTSLLSPAEYGSVDLVNTYVQLLIPIIIIQMDQGVFRFLIDSRSDEDKLKEVLSTSIFYIVRRIILFVIIALVVNQFYTIEYLGYVIFVLIGNILSSYFLQVSRGLGQVTSYTVISFIIGVVSILLNVAFVLGLRMGAQGMLLAMGISNIFGSIIAIYKLKFHRAIKRGYENPEMLKEMKRYSLPLLPNALSWWVVNASNKIIISIFLGVDANGLISVATKFSGIYSTIYNYFNLSWTESATLHINDEDRTDFFSKVINNTSMLFFSFALLIIAVMPFVFSYLVNETYSSAYYQIPIYVVAASFNTVIGLFTSIYIAQKNTRAVANTTMLAAVINFALNIVLVNIIGIYAASFASLISYGVLMVNRYYDTKKFLDIKIKKSVVIFYALSLLVVLVPYYLEIRILELVALLIVTIIVIYMNRNMISSVLGFIKKKVRG